MIPLPEQIRAVWEAADRQCAEARDARAIMDDPASGGGLLKRMKLRAESADRDREALLAAHATLSGLKT